MLVPKFVGRRFDDVEMSTLLLTGWIPIHVVRKAFLRIWGAKVHATAVVSHGLQVRSARRLFIGERTQVGENGVLDARGGLRLASDVNLSSEVHIWTAQHAWNDPTFAYISAPVTVGHHVWIGPRVTVLPGSVIHPGTVVAAGAVVSGEVGPNALVGGIPAKKIRDRDPMEYELPRSGSKAWWW
jgi:acetyltransferase-like isoleucine patch superfamily enzyme